MKPTIEPKPEPTEAEIQHAAYFLWIEAGRPEGHDLEHWFAAKELLRHHHGRPPTRHRRLALSPFAIPSGSSVRTNN